MSKRMALIVASVPLSLVFVYEMALKYGTWIYPAYIAVLLGGCFYKMYAPDTKGNSGEPL